MQQEPTNSSIYCLDTEVEFTQFTSLKPCHQSKTISLSENGTLNKAYSDGMQEGYAVMHSITDLQELADIQNSCESNQFLVYGKFAGAKPGEQIPIGVKCVAANSANLGARSNAYMLYPDGASIMLFDIDAKQGESAREKLELLYKEVPELTEADRIERESCSSFIRNNQNGDTITDVAGIHVYFIATNAQEIGAMAKLIEQRLWLRGHGKIVVCVNGRPKEQTLFDTSVFQPTREDFIAKANVVEPLVQAPIASRVIRSNKRSLSLNAFEKLSEKEVSIVNSLIEAAIEKKSPEIEAKKKEFQQKRLDACTDLRKKKILKENLDKVSQNVLPEDWILMIYKGGFKPEPVTVAEILAEPDRYEGLKCAEPEDPDYKGGAPRGQINAKRKVPNVYSYHSGTMFRLGTSEKLSFFDWSEPVELEENDENEHLSFPIDSLPEIMKNAVVEVSHNNQVSTALAAMSALAAASLSCQRLCNVSRAPYVTKPSPISLYIMVSAESGERKSSIDALMNVPFYDFIAEKSRDFQNQLEQYKIDHDVWSVEYEASKSAYGNLIRSKANPTKGKPAPSDHEIELARLNQKAVLEKEPKAPKAFKLITADFSSERLIELLALNKNIAVMTSEGGRFFNCYGLSREHIGKSLADINDYWSGSPASSERKVASSYFLDGSDRLLIMVMAQPKVISQFVEGNDVSVNESGFLARFLLATPPSTMGTRFITDETASSNDCLIRYQHVIAKLIRATDELIRKEQDAIVLYFSTEGLESWVNFYNDIESRQLTEYAAINGFAAKASEQCARLASIFHILENVDRLPNLPTRISAENVRKASDLMKWFLNEAQIMVGKKSNGMSWRYSRAKRSLDKIIEYCIRNNTESMPISKFSSAIKVDKQEYTRILEILECQNCVRVEHAAIGKGINIWINPKLIEKKKAELNAKTVVLPHVSFSKSSNTPQDEISNTVVLQNTDNTEIVTVQNVSVNEAPPAEDCDWLETKSLCDYLNTLN